MKALSIAVSLQHFSPYIVASHHKTCVLSDSKPCVQAYNRLCKGHFSHSSRVNTFLSTASRYSVQLQHLDGSVNVPSDFACRNAPECFNTSCQIMLLRQRPPDSHRTKDRHSRYHLGYIQNAFRQPTSMAVTTIRLS